MTDRELDAAAITDPRMRAAYAHCRELNARHGRTYFLATRLLPPDRRPAVHALYGFARWADDIVDAVDSAGGSHRDREVGDGGGDADRRAAALDRLDDDLARGLAGGEDTPPVVAALADTSRRYAIDHRHFADFLTSMRSDLTVTEYAHYDDLRGYMHGSAAVIGLQMLPVLGTVVPREEAAPHAAELGIAFQLTNFLRDIGEDLDRGRVYLPQDLLTAHGVDRQRLRYCRDTGRTDRRVTAALRDFASLTRAAYRRAAPGVSMLDPLARPCIRTALVLYSGILDAVAADDWALHRRAVVPRRRRAAVAADGLLRVTAARLDARRGPAPAPARPPHPPARSGDAVTAAPPGNADHPLRLRRAPVAWERQRPTWREARPSLIADALERSQARPSGNWYVLGASRDLRPDRPLARTVASREVVAWRDARGRFVAGPGVCPHLGAPLRDSPVRCGTLVCHWHGLSLDGTPLAGWEPWPAHDDGTLLWVRLDDAGGEQPTDRPPVPARPTATDALTAVYTGTGVCEPDDVVANRLDPWHGAWFHPYSFVDLTVVNAPGPQDDEDAFTVDVSFKVAGRLVVPVRATFTAPTPRTVVMRITDGEGAGSVVETHATPLEHDGLGRPRTAVVEAVTATSERPGFAVTRRAAPLLRPLIRYAAGRLWRDDLAYAERRWALRSTGRHPG